MPNYYPVAGTLPEGFCPETWQATLNQFASLLPITVPTLYNVVIQQAEPGVDERDKLWIKTLAAAPWVDGAYVYTEAAWRRVPGLPIYFADTGAADALVITTGDSIASAAFLSGRLLLVRAANANTGASTLNVDGLGAKAIKKQGVNDTVSGDFVAGQILVLVYDSITDNFELVTTLGTVTAVQKAAVVKYVVANGVAPQVITTGSQQDVALNTEVDPSGLLSIASNEITLNDSGTYSITASTALYPNAAGQTLGVLILRDTSAGADLATVSWTCYQSGGWVTTAVLHHAATFSAGQKLKLQLVCSGQSVRIGGESAASAGMNETYVQMLINRIA